MPGCVDNLITGVTLLLFADKALKEVMKRNKAKPTQLPLVVKELLRIRKEGAIVEDPDSANVP